MPPDCTGHAPDIVNIHLQNKIYFVVDKIAYAPADKAVNFIVRTVLIDAAGRRRAGKLAFGVGRKAANGRYIKVAGFDFHAEFSVKPDFRSLSLIAESDTCFIGA